MLHTFSTHVLKEFQAADKPIRLRSKARLPNAELTGSIRVQYWRNAARCVVRPSNLARPVANGGVVQAFSSRPLAPSTGVGTSVGWHESQFIHGRSRHALYFGGIGFAMYSLPYIVHACSGRSRVSAAGGLRSGGTPECLLVNCAACSVAPSKARGGATV